MRAADHEVDRYKVSAAVDLTFDPFHAERGDQEGPAGWGRDSLRESHRHVARYNRGAGSSRVQLHDPFALPGASSPFDPERVPSQQAARPLKVDTFTPSWERPAVPSGEAPPGGGADDDAGGACGPLECLAGDDRVLPRSAYASTVAFCAYCAVYGLRSPWRAASYERERDVLGVEYKDAMTIVWTIAYFLGKALSAPILGGITRRRRVPLLAGCVLLNLAAWGGFALFPQREGRWEDAGRLACLFISSTPLAFFWCCFFRYLEGRDYSEFLGACMSAAIIIGSGIAKSLGTAITDLGVSEETMPIVAAGWLVPLIVGFVLLVNALPDPTAAEAGRKGERVRMTTSAQWALLRTYWPGLLLLFVSICANTALRDYRDVFMKEMWEELNDGEGMPSYLFTLTEAIVAAVVLLAIASVACIRSNTAALWTLWCFCVVGCVLVVVSQLAASRLWDHGKTGQAVWLTATGIGIFLMYIPVSAVLYDRLVAALQVRATSVFLISVSDTLGYCGSVGLLLFRNYDDRMETMQKHKFFRDSALYGSVWSAVCLLASMAYFYWVLRRQAQDPSTRPLL